MNKRNIKLIGVLVIILLVFAGCTQNGVSDVKEIVNIYTLAGPTGMGMVKMMSDGIEADNYSYDFTVATAPDQLTAGILNGEIDIAAVPTNLASVLYNKTEGKIQLAAVNTLGVLYILEDGNQNINSIADLKGKTIYATGQGSTPEYILNYVLKENSIDPEEDVNIEYKSEHGELATLVQTGEVEIALLPQPFVTIVTMNNKNVKIAVDMTEEWEKIQTNNSLPMGCIVVNKEFAEKNPESIEAFLKAYEVSVAFVNESPKEASVLIEKQGILPKAKIAELAIPKSNIVYISAQESKDMISSFLNILFENNPKSVGGKIPDNEFYYSK